MVASAVFITDLQGKAIISRNYRGDVPLTKAIEQFAKYLADVEEEAKKPVFHVDPNGDIVVGEDVGGSGLGGEHFVYVAVSKNIGGSLFCGMNPLSVSLSTLARSIQFIYRSKGMCTCVQ
jgi:predicted NBD/HSP70 family sugar kinase